MKIFRLINALIITSIFAIIFIIIGIITLPICLFVDFITIFEQFIIKNGNGYNNGVWPDGMLYAKNLTIKIFNKLYYNK